MKSLLLVLSFFSCLFCFSQRHSTTDTATVKAQIDSINRLLDRSVVNKNKSVLQQHYAEDFVFTHGTGLIDSKSSWMRNVLDTAVHFISREHDSTVVELHGNVAIVKGTLTVKRQQPQLVSAYALQYVRVFARRNKVWQLISHRTTAEWHL